MRYVFDLDNTLCDTQKNSEGNWDYINSKPFVERINLVNKLYEEDNYIIIETARGSVSKKNWYEETHQQLVSFGLKFHELRTGVKFNGDIFIDDKGMNSEVFFSEKEIKIIRPNENKTNITLFNEIFVEKNTERLNEYLFCINKNIQNPLVEKIYLVCNEDLYSDNITYFNNIFDNLLVETDKIFIILDKNKRFTFNSLVNFCKKLVSDGSIVCASNLDIFLPYNENWKNLQKDFFSITGNECCLALSRTEYINDSYSFRDEGAWERGEFADCWVFKTPMNLKNTDMDFDIPVGSAPTCDNYMFSILSKTHKVVFNWAQKYEIYHLDLVRKPDLLENKHGRMILHDDVVVLPKIENDDEYWKITPYQDWDEKLKNFVLDKKIKSKKMEKGALEDKFVFDEISKLIDKFDIKRIVETGTYLGWSTKKFCEFGIKVDTIEVNEEYYDESNKSLKFKNLKKHLGNSVSILDEIIEDGEENVLFFIDSHWYDLPLLSELETIKKKSLKPVIVIHDFFVPDDNGNSKFGYDEYDGIKIDYNLIENRINSIYDGEFEFHYNDAIDCVDSGLIYIYPKLSTNERTN